MHTVERGADGAAKAATRQCCFCEQDGKRAAGAADRQLQGMELA